MDNELMHYGTPRHSGRYPWGSGKDPYQRDSSFLGNVHNLRKQGLSETEIARGMGLNTKELRNKISAATREKRAYESAEALRLRNKGLSYTAIAKRMGKNESSVRSLLNPVLKERSESTVVNADILKKAVEDKKYIDVGTGSELLMGLRRHQLDLAVTHLKSQGYEVHYIPVEQLGTGKNTNIKVLAAPGTPWSEVAKNKDQIRLVNDVYSEDGGKTVRPFEPPVSIDSKRVKIKYAEEGGVDKDGVIELRRGVDDISLGKAKYAQVRIAVDGTHYLKGMAMYSDDMPDGVDIIFNTNKKVGTPKEDVFKPLKDDPDNPFGASIKSDDKLLRAQRHYIDADGNERLSALNIVNEEGNWSTWSKNLASQFLSKQNPSLIKKQLDMSYSIAKEEFDEIMSYNQPTVRATLLDKFASQCDSDAVHLQAAALPRQSTKVILPFPDMKEGEVYAPNLRDGEHVALVRYPHGGIFEIPTLVVNNKHKGANAAIQNAIDAIGINSKVAERLSGADFDGDTVIMIPIDNVKIKTSAPLDGLKNFNPKEEYPRYEGMHIMTSHEKGVEMGKVSNLITDMTIKGATSEEICRAVKHSMVVIDAEKHKLDYKRSEIENNIAELKVKYQGRADAGASTLISRSTSEIRVNQRKQKVPSKMTPEERKRWEAGEIIWEETGKTYTKREELKSGKIKETVKPRLESSTKMAEVGDAFELVSRDKDGNTTRVETIYANYANSMKALANSARAAARAEVDIPYSPSASKVYAKEVSSLKAKLNIALMNAPLERQAQLIANKSVATKRYNNPDMDNEHLKRLKGQELDAARMRVGAHKQQVQITENEWEAINAGAINKSTLKRILSNADTSRIRELATPRSSVGMSPGKVAKAQSMLANGYTQAEVADSMGVSVSTLLKAVE